MTKLNLSNMTETQLDKAYEAAVENRKMIKSEIQHLNSQLVFDKGNETITELIIKKEELLEEVKEEIRLILRA